MDKDGDFQMTPDEVDRIKHAMKDKKFVELLVEYSKEISDPVNKKKYEDEIIAMEKERGQNVQILVPQSGFVVKTARLSDGMKVFLNICTSSQVEEYKLSPETSNGKVGNRVYLPHTLTPVREDFDKAGKPCIVYDICFNPKTYSRSLEDLRFKQLLLDSAFDTLEKHANLKFDRKGKRFPKMKYKGTPQTNIIREKSTQHESAAKSIGSLKASAGNIMTFDREESKEASDKVSNGRNLSPLATVNDPCESKTNITPQYKIVHRGFFDMQDFTYSREDYSTIPKELLVKIDLPLAKSAAGIDLDIFEKEVVLESKDLSYYVNIPLPYKISEIEGHAQFDTAERVLTVTLPVVKPERLFRKSSFLIEEVNGRMRHETSEADCASDSVGASLQDDVVNKENMSNEISIESKDTADSMINNDKSPLDVDRTEGIILEGIKKHLDNGGEDQSDNSNFQCLAKIPEYSVTQMSDKISVLLHIPNVKEDCLSLEFDNRQASMSYPHNSEDSISPHWKMLIRLDDNCYLDKDSCGKNLTDEKLELILKKREDAEGQWEKIHIGLSEESLQVEYLSADHIADQILKSPTLSKVVRNENSMNCENSDENVSLNRISETGDNDKEEALIASALGSVSIQDDLSAKNTAIVINNANVRDVPPRHAKTIPSEDCNSQSSKAPETITNRQVIGRSYSHEPFESGLRLRSILKRSKSDGEIRLMEEEGEVDDEEEEGCNNDNCADFYFNAAEHEYSRSRNKSVTFMDEPTIFEFAKLSKRQLKKQEKQERLGKGRSKPRGILQESFSRFTQFSGKASDESDGGEKNKRTEKKGKSDKKNSLPSTDQLEENNIVSGSKNSKKKKNKLKKKKSCDKNESDSPSSEINPTSQPNGTQVTTLNNPLIYELE